MIYDQRESDLQDLKKAIGKSANWFYSIAGLSVLNAILAVADAKVHFIIGSFFVDFGIGMTLVEGTFAKFFGGLILTLSLGFWILMGRLANRPLKWAFTAGMGIYLIDGLLYLVFEDFLSAAFHAYALYNIYKGISFIDEYRALQNDIATNPIQIETQHAETIPEGDLQYIPLTQIDTGDVAQG